MLGVADKHVSWDRYFSKANRIEANYVADHRDYPVHDHEFVEVVVVVGGSCRHHSVLGERPINKGDAFLFRPGAWHAYRNCQSLSLYNCCFDPALLGHELSWMVDDPLLGRLLWSIPLAPAQRGMVALRLSNTELAHCRTLLEELCAISKVSSATHRADKLGLLLQLLGVLARQIPADKMPVQPTKPPLAVLTALKLIDDNPAEPWSLAALAVRTHVQPAYLVRSFTRLAGLPPMAYLRRRRLELAASLLARSNEPVGQVANLVGWPDANYFTRRFRAEFGLTPSAYRLRVSKLSANLYSEVGRKPSVSVRHRWHCEG